MVDDFNQSNKQMMIGCTDMSLEDLRMRVEADLSAVIGSTGAAAQWVVDLNTWLLGMNDRSRKATVSSRQVFRNRCGVRTAQAQRLQRLWHNWHSDTGESMAKSSSPRNREGLSASSNTDDVENLNMPPLPIWSISVTRSLDDAEWAAPLLTPSTPGPKESRKSNHAHFLPSATEAVLYYDSDPEVFRQASKTSPRGPPDSPPLSPKSKPIRRRRQISIPAAIDTSASMVSRDEECPPTPRNDFNKGAPSFDMPPSFDNLVELSEEETVHEFIRVRGFDPFSLSRSGVVSGCSCQLFFPCLFQELTFKKTTLVWHPSPERATSKKNKSSSPVSVEGWFELGSRLPTTLIQPKFMWRETYQPDLLNRKRLGTTYRKPSSLDLLTMIRIVKPSTLDRSVYPFAKLDKTFTILTHTNELHVFEAVSSQERDWLVHGLKLAVARLASMIIVGDDQMFVEFFSPWAYAPPLLEGSGDDEGGAREAEERVQEEDTRVTKGIFDSTTDREREELWGKPH
jgi:hypothetical protein